MIRKPCCSRFSLYKFVHLKIFGPNSKTCTCEVRAAQGRESQDLTVLSYICTVVWKKHLVKMQIRVHQQKLYNYNVHSVWRVNGINMRMWIVIGIEWCVWFPSILCIVAASAQCLLTLKSSQDLIFRHWLLINDES